MEQKAENTGGRRGLWCPSMAAALVLLGFWGSATAQVAEELVQTVGAGK